MTTNRVAIIRLLIRDLCLFGCAEFIPLMRVGMGGMYVVRLALMLVIKLQLLSMLPSHTDYLLIQYYAGCALGIHFIAWVIGLWPSIPDTPPAGECWVTRYGAGMAGFVVELFLVLIFTWASIWSPAQAPYPPPLGYEVSAWLLDFRMHEWVDIKVAVPLFAIPSLLLLPLVDWEAPPRIDTVREPLLTFSKVRSPETKRLPVPSAINMALDLQAERKIA